MEMMTINMYELTSKDIINENNIVTNSCKNHTKKNEKLCDFKANKHVSIAKSRQTNRANIICRFFNKNIYDLNQITEYQS